MVYLCLSIVKRIQIIVIYFNTHLYSIYIIFISQTCILTHSALPLESSDYIFFKYILPFKL